MALKSDRDLVLRIRSSVRSRRRRVSRFPRHLARRIPYDILALKGLDPSSIVRLYWWNALPNFGDQLSPWLIRALGEFPVYASPRRCESVAIGSVLDALPDDYSGVVWGSGIRQDRNLYRRKARVLALRGHLSQDRMARPGSIALGDPALLLSKYVSAPRTRSGVGVVTHFQRRPTPSLELLVRKEDGYVRLIDVRQPPAQVVREIASCSFILSSSLHGLVVADALGVPAARLAPDRKLAEGDFKFADYESVLDLRANRTIRFHPDAPLDELTSACQSPSRAVIDSICTDLLRAWGER